MSDIVERMREDASAHFEDAKQWDQAPEQTCNWQRGLNANESADTIETLRQRVKELEDEAKMPGKCSRAMLPLLEELATLKQAQEPVAWISKSSAAWFGQGNGAAQFSYIKRDEYCLPLYLSAPTIPEGWQLVPVEPSRDWCEKFAEATQKRWPLDSLRREIQQVLSAAPKPGEPA